MASTGVTRRQAARALCALPFVGRAVGQTGPAIEAQQLSEELYVVSGDGGNIGVLMAPNAVMMIDGGFAERAEALLEWISKHVDSDLVTILFNTNWHVDHTGCNETLGTNGTRIIAHENVKKRLRAAKMKPNGIPSTTFAESGKLSFVGIPVEYVHIPEAASDGDAYVYFPDINVLQAGDLFCNGFYPAIDYSSGGWIGGMAEGARKLLMVGDAGTQIIPGHGPVGNKVDLQAFAGMLTTVHERLAQLAARGKSLQEVVENSPLKDLDADWGFGPIRPELFLRQAYSSVLRRKAR